MDTNGQISGSDKAPEVEASPELSEDQPSTETPRVAPIESRFLFVDVAAQRANQLRRGALPKVSQHRTDPSAGDTTEVPVRLERIAMEEVRAGLIVYDLPAPRVTDPEETK